MGLMDRLQHAWNAFIGEETNVNDRYIRNELGYASYHRPDRPIIRSGNEKSIVNSIYNRIAIDCASVDIKHVRLDNHGRYTEEIKSKLNNCLVTETNLDQTAYAFKIDVIMSLLQEGCIAIVPIDTTIDPFRSTSFDIETMRVGKITQWYPKFIKMEVYNDKTGKRQEITMPKKSVAIIENPLSTIMNDQNSTLKRLIRKLNILDVIDEQSGSGKLDMIIQLPYVVKTETRRQQAEQRRKDIEQQLSGSKFGIAYTDGTERITQLNRPVENNMLKQIEFLTNMLYSQLGITQSVLEGTADEKTMNNYRNRTIVPILTSVVDEMNRKFLTKTARSQNQKIMYFNDPFKLIPVTSLAEIADKFTRNEIMSSNEVRQTLGMAPINDPKADELRNKNINAGSGQQFPTVNQGQVEQPQPANLDEGGINQNGEETQM